jgi:hypothetical protein
MFPGAKNLYITGSPSANIFYDVYSNYAGSWLDTMNDMDRIRQANGTCISKFGCNTFFPLQNSGLETYTNNGFSNYNALTFTLRRAVSNGWGYDFNYTYGHALDNGSSSETSGGAALQDAFNPRAYYGTSDFDARHTVTADAVVQIPVGKGKALLGNIPGWANQIVGGWQVTTLPPSTAAIRLPAPMRATTMSTTSTPRSASSPPALRCPPPRSVSTTAASRASSRIRTW